MRLLPGLMLLLPLVSPFAQAELIDDVNDRGELIIATEGAYPPFNYVDSDNKLHGFDVDITEELCKRMDAQCTIVAQDWDGIIAGLMAKKYDAIVASMIVNEERKKKIAFTNHYYRTPLSIAVAKDSDITDAQSDVTISHSAFILAHRAIAISGSKPTTSPLAFLLLNGG